MNISVLMDWSKRELRPDNLLIYSFLMVFFCMPFGTAVPTLFLILAALFWVLSGKIVEVKNTYRHSWFHPVLLLIVLPWMGLLYTQDTLGFGIAYAKKTHYWIYCLAIASIPSLSAVTDKFTKAFFLGLAVNALIGLLQFAGIYPASTEGFTGLGRQYTTVSVYLIIGILMSSFYFKHTADKKIKILTAGFLALFFFHLLLLKGRTGYITLILLSPLVIINLLKNTRIYKLCGMFVILLSLMSLSPMVRERLGVSFDRIQYHMKAESAESWGKKYSPQEDRFYMWYGAVNMFLDHPVLGVGTGGYTTVLKQRGDPEDPLIAHPHNDLLYMAVSYGIAGIFAFCWLFYEVLKNSLKQRHTNCGYFVFATALVILVSGLFNARLIDSGTAMLLGLSVGLQENFFKQA